jgi:tetratricopeptide (TPR) repeat protein
MTPTELGTVTDLIETIAREKPLGIHFSGHGGPGQLQFENDEGESDVVSIRSLLDRLRQRLPDGGLPKFFYLASCHGNEPGAPDKGRAGSESSAAAVQRAGVPQVVGYYGPILDELSTRAEEALYCAIAAGQSTRYAVRQARRVLTGPIFATRGSHRPDESFGPSAAGLRDTHADTHDSADTHEGASCSGSSSGSARATRQEQPAAGTSDDAAAAAVEAGTHPFAWAQLVFYHHGPDQPLSRPVPPEQLRQIDASLRRTFTGTGDRKILSTGFIGRRSELHRVRKQLRRGDRVLVFQGLGGLGKTTLAFQTLPLIAPKEDDVCAIWCREAEQATDPAEALVAQLLEYCRRRFGLDWEGVVQQVDRAAGNDSVQRFAYYFQTLLGNVERLVVYLDNLESLLVAPRSGQAASAGATDDAQEFAEWRSEALRNIWRLFVAAARDSGKLHVVASCRYVNDDLRRHRMPVSPLPPDAMFRLSRWFSSLRRLAGETRAKLVARLDGHPRAAEYANDLIEHTLAMYEDQKGAWQLPEPPAAADVEREWTTLVEPALPQVREKLRDNLLLAEIWEQVLDERARRMLFRMTLLRRPWEWGLMSVLGEPEEDAAAAEATAERLARTSLLEQVEVLRNAPSGGRQLVRDFTLHPATAEFVAARLGDDPDRRVAAHRRIGDWLEAEAARSPYIETDLEAGHHLFAAGEYDRSYDLLGPASMWLQDHGRVREGLRVLRPLLAEPVRSRLAPERAGRLLGTVGRAYHRLGQVEQAIEYYEQQSVIVREIGDRRGEGAALGNLGLAYADLGQVEQAIGYHEQALVILREIGNRQDEGSTLGNLGLAYAALGQVEQAIGYHEQALVIHREIGDRRGEGNALGNLGRAYADLGQVEQAIGYYEQQLVIVREIGDRRGEGAALGNLGSAYADLGQVEQAIGYYEQALVIFREIGDRRGEGNALGNLGSAYADLGQVEQAKGYWRAAVTIGQEIKDPRMVKIFSGHLQKHGG